MSGHSKWATTKRKKAAIDSKRAQIFTKMAKLITIAARDGGGGDPGSNPSLRMAIDNAKGASMPKENIDRAIKRGAGGGEGANIEEVVYEAYGPGGVAIMIECLTDNKNRTVSEIKAILNRSGGSIASPGSVSYQFKKEGLVIVNVKDNQISGEELELKIIDSGAEDFELEDGAYYINTGYTALDSVKKNLEKDGITIESAEVVLSPTASIEISEEKQEAVEKLLSALDDLDDVNKISTNADL